MYPAMITKIIAIEFLTSSSIGNADLLIRSNVKTGRKRGNDLGMLLDNTVLINEPSMRFLFGSTANSKDASPIISISSIVNCDGWKGYPVKVMMEKTISEIVRKVFIRKRIEDALTLLMHLLPSFTTSGRVVKSEFVKTI